MSKKPILIPELILHRDSPFSPNHFSWKSAADGQPVGGRWAAGGRLVGWWASGRPVGGQWAAGGRPAGGRWAAGREPENEPDKPGNQFDPGTGWNRNRQEPTRNIPEKSKIRAIPRIHQREKTDPTRAMHCSPARQRGNRTRTGSQALVTGQATVTPGPEAEKQTKKRWANGLRRVRPGPARGRKERSIYT